MVKFSTYGTYDASYDFGFPRSRACGALPFAENPHSKADSKGVHAARYAVPAPQKESAIVGS